MNKIKEIILLQLQCYHWSTGLVIDAWNDEEEGNVGRTLCLLALWPFIAIWDLTILPITLVFMPITVAIQWQMEQDNVDESEDVLIED